MGRGTRALPGRGPSSPGSSSRDVFSLRFFFFLVRRGFFSSDSFFFPFEKEAADAEKQILSLSFAPRLAHPLSTGTLALSLSQLLAQRCRGPWRRVQSRRRSEPLLPLSLRRRAARAAIGVAAASSSQCSFLRRLDQCSRRRGSSRPFLPASRSSPEPSQLFLLTKTTTMTT